MYLNKYYDFTVVENSSDFLPVKWKMNRSGYNTAVLKTAQSFNLIKPLILLYLQLFLINLLNIKKLLSNTLCR